MADKKREKHIDDVRNSEAIPARFVINKWSEKKFRARSIQISEDVLQRFDALANDHRQYSKKAILDALLNEALEKYGY